MNKYFSIVIILIFLTLHSIFGHANYIGYSGAPGTSGRCASQCHGSSGGTIIIQGFPTSYIPGQIYTIKVKHTTGSKIGNFNASIRVGTGSITAGTITAGYNSATYSTSSEPNGIHFSSNNQDSCSFIWLAPSSGVGDITFYLGGLQGTSASGQNTSITLTASQAQGVYDVENKPIAKSKLQISPSIVSRILKIYVTVPNPNSAQLRILQVDGKVINHIQIPRIANTNQIVNFKTVDKTGRLLPNGIYMVSLVCGKEQVIKKFVIRN